MVFAYLFSFFLLLTLPVFFLLNLALLKLWPETHGYEWMVVGNGCYRHMKIGRDGVQWC